MKAIKINVATQQVEEVTIGTDYKEIYGQIGNDCNLFCCPVEFENGDVLYADDEGLLKDQIGAFMLKNFSYPITGNAIILGSTEEGDSADAKTSVTEIMDQIVFLNKQQAEQYQIEAAGYKVEIISF